MKELWARTWDQGSNGNMPCLDSCGEDLAATAKSADTFLQCSSFLRSLTEHCSATNELLTKVISIVQNVASTQSTDINLTSQGFNVGSHPSQVGAASGSRGTPEPNYVHVDRNSRVPPGQVLLPGIIKGELFWGGLGPVLNVDWLHWRGVTHVLNCEGSTPRDRNHARLTSEAREHPHGQIQYIDWCIDRQEDRGNYLCTLNRLDIALRHPGTCLYVHCCSGRLSAMTVYALLRLRFAVSPKDAWQALQSRKYRSGRACAEWDSEMNRWIESVHSS